MLSRITGILGPFPEHVLLNGKDTAKYFILSNIVYERTEDGRYMYTYPKKTTLAARLHIDVKVADEDELLFLQFVEELLNLDPKKRHSAKSALKHKWLQDVGEVDYYPKRVDADEEVDDDVEDV